jgi:flagellar biosynthetic protein FliQ
MTTTTVGTLMRDAVLLVLKIGGPLLLLSMVVGVVVAIFQAVTQIHEQTLGFILKLVVIVAVLLMGGGWMMENLTSYTLEIFRLIAS